MLCTAKTDAVYDQAALQHTDKLTIQLASSTHFLQYLVALALQKELPNLQSSLVHHYLMCGAEKMLWYCVNVTEMRLLLSSALAVAI